MHSQDPSEELEREFPRDRLLAWLERSGYAAESLSPLTGDVSPRRYLRVELSAGETVILVCYPESMRSVCRRFAVTAERLEAVGVRVPALLTVDCDTGLMVTEDAGDETLYDRRDAGWPILVPYLERAVEYARRIAAISPPEVSELSPPLDEALLRQELVQTWELFLLPRGLCGGTALSDALRRGLKELCRHLGSEQPIACHRDFMGRNLVPLEPSDLMVLDHQDLRLGPRFYDLASLCNDSLFPPRWVEMRLLGPLLESAEDRASYHRAAAQRALKAIGTFEAFARRGFDRHRGLIAPTLQRALDHLALLPEIEPLAAELQSLWSPLLDSEAGVDLLD